MGADLLMAAFRWPTTPEGKPARRTDALFEEMQRRLLDALEEVAHPAEYGFNIEDTPTWRVELVESYAERFESLFTTFELPRDCGVFVDDAGTEWVVTAGMSSGMPPTDSYELVELISLTGITDRPYG